MCCNIEGGLKGQVVKIFVNRHLQKRWKHKVIFRLFDYGVETLPSTLNSARLKMDLQQPKMSSCCQFTKLKAVLARTKEVGRNNPQQDALMTLRHLWMQF